MPKDKEIEGEREKGNERNLCTFKWTHMLEARADVG